MCRDRSWSLVPVPFSFPWDNQSLNNFFSPSHFVVRNRQYVRYLFFSPFLSRPYCAVGTARLSDKSFALLSFIPLFFCEKSTNFTFEYVYSVQLYHIYLLVWICFFIMNEKLLLVLLFYLTWIFVNAVLYVCVRFMHH